jgi:hypothetical protein
MPAAISRRERQNGLTTSLSKQYFRNINFERIVAMYAQPMYSSQLADARIAEIRRQSTHGGRSAATVAERRTTIAAPLPVRRRAGWWLVTVGLRMAVGTPQGVRSASAR